VRGLAAGERAARSRTRRAPRDTVSDRAAASLDAAAIAVGHSLDDQAETFLLRLIRGAGPAGSRRVRPRAGRVIRPLLEIPRAELRAYAGEHGLRFREDSSNADVGIPRNRVRLELLPHLEQFSPAIAAILAREAALARADDEFLEAAAIEWAVRSSYRKTTASRSTPRRWRFFTPLWPPVWRGQLCRQLRPAASSVFSMSTICWTSPGGRTGRRSHCRDWWRGERDPGSCSAAPRRRPLRTLSAFRCLFQVR
jgi:tRNA(Ile)-lysidine synthase TilS/MesJ